MDTPGRARWLDAAPERPPVEPGGAPLAGASIAAFTLGVAGTTAAWAGIAPVETAAVGFLAVATGLVLAVPTLATGFLGYLSVPPGSELRRLAGARWLVLAAAAAFFLAAAALLDDGYRSGDVSGLGVGTAAGGELVLVLGAALGFARRGPGKKRSVDRDSSKHGPRLDDELAREAQSLGRGAPIESRVEEGREKEGPGEEDRDVDARTGPASRLGADAVEARRELSRHLRPTVFPADRDRLVVEAERNAAPAPVVDALRSLPAGTEFRTAHEVWIGLTEPREARDRDALRARASTEPIDES
jgi:Protein of unknown function (DUF2795)